MKRILAIAQTSDFRNFTRRYTFEAIAKLYKGVDAICYSSIKNLFSARNYSEFMNVYSYYRVVPEKLILRNGIIKQLENVNLKIGYKRIFDRYDIFIFSSPIHSLFKPYCNGAKIFIISDPYHLMGYDYKCENELIKSADVIFTTSKNLKHVYLPKYFNYHNEKNVHYWPNCVDIDVWSYEKLTKFRRKSQKIVIGFAGNFMEIVDLDLLEHVVTKFPDYEFQFAGKITASRTDVEFSNKLRSIFEKPNVKYMGYYPFDDIPKVVINWDVCMMIDNKSELSSYHHHNKLYQYLALGKPVVINRNHNDYDEFRNLIFISNDYAEFVENINRAVRLIDDREYIKRAIKAAEENSTAVRARQFLTVLRNENILF
jgi:hypothetical protein